MDLRYKFGRVVRWSKRIGLLNAISFEVQQTLRRRVISFMHGSLGRRIHLRSSSSDIEVFEQIFIEDEFAIPLDSPKFIVDGGANCGLASLYLAVRYPGAKIIAVEPNAENCALCVRNTRGMNVEVVRTAIWSSSTRLKIENPGDAPWSFRCVEADAGDPAGFEACDMGSILSGRQCDLVKLDIEGAELELFKDTGWLKDVSAILVETHGDEADALVRRACEGWTISQSGEKLLLVR